MEKGDVDDIFNDFEHKVEGKESSHSTKKEDNKHIEKELSEEEILNNKYKEAEQALKQKYKKEKTTLEEKKKKEIPKHQEEHGHFQTKDSSFIERIAYVAIIVVLVTFIAIDLSFYHGGKDAGTDSEAITAAAVNSEDKANETENKTVEKTAEEIKSVEKKVVVEEKKLSGRIGFAIVKVYRKIIDEDTDMGEISKITFTIANGKDKVLTPIVEIYAYDTENKEQYETRIRATYSYEIGIKPGGEHTATVDLLPKIFRNLDLEKSIRLTLNDTKTGFIKSINKEITIS